MADTPDAAVQLTTGLAALRDREGILHALFEGSLDAILLADDHGHYIDANPAACGMFGFPREQFIGRSLIDFAPADFDAAAGYRSFLEQGRTRGIFPMLRSDGSRRVLDYTAIANVAPGVHLAALRDITEQVAAGAELRANRDLLEEAQAIAHVGSWSSGAGPDDEIAWSHECYRILGLAPGTATKVSSFLQLVHADDREHVKRASRDALEGIAPYDVAHRVTRPDGGVRWVRQRANVERDGAGRATRMVGTIQDVTDRHLADEAVRTSEAELRLLAEAMPQIVWISGPDGHTVYFNQQWTLYTGLTLEQSASAGWTTAVHPGDQQRAAAARAAATAGVGSYTVECRLRRRDGVYHWWLVRGVPVMDANGTVFKWFGTCTDVDSLKQGEERLRVLHQIGEVLRTAPEHALRQAMRILGQHLGVSRCTYAIVDADHEHYDVTADFADGCASSEGRYLLADLGSQLLAALHRGAEPVVVRDLDAEVEDQGTELGPAGIKAVICCSLLTDGKLCALMAVHQVVPRDWTPGEISLVREVADRCWATIEKTALDARLSYKSAMIRMAGKVARLGGWTLALPSRVLTWSDQVCAIHEVALGTVPTLTQALDFYAPEYRQILSDKLTACITDGSPFDLEAQILTATRRRVWVRAIGNAERSADGTVTGVLGAFQDIDGRRKLEDQLRQAVKMEAVGRLAGGVAHDFNNLLSVVLSYSELALEELRPGDPLRVDFEEIRQAGERGTALTRQLLAFSKQHVLAPQVLDLQSVIAAMKPMLGRLLGADVNLTLLAIGPIGRVLADPTQIEQVVMNLAVNARDAMPRGGNLTIELANASFEEPSVGGPEHPPGQFVLLAVTDSGTGMDEATRAHIFEPFFTTKEQGKGTGLGLATVFGIVQQSGGFLRVYSELEHGTAFKIYFPRTERAPAPVSASIAVVLDGTETILIVEDEDQVRTVACAILRRRGYTVLEASNGGEAYLVSSEFAARIDLLLTDVVMPRMSGRKVAEQLATQRPEMKVLFISGYTDDTVIHHGVLDSGISFLQKPFTPNALLKKVRDALDDDRRPLVRAPSA
ncbi:MAG: PAS domain-containing protein [Kofleriaceae bacterium]